MNNGFQWWLVILGIGLGAGLLWLVLGRLPRQDDDIGTMERGAEAIWISRTIESGGGIAPVALVEEILDLHGTYLEGPPLLVEPAADPPGSPIADLPPEGPLTGARSGAPFDPWTADPLRPRPPLSVGDGPSVQRHDTRRETPEADVRQAG